jgi:L-asparaginase
MSQASILIIYTGGTIGMIQDAETGELQPFDFNHLLEQVPELKRLEVHLDTHAFRQPVDSSNMHPGIWQEIAAMIVQKKGDYHGFVILHGSDTMAFTASALSFMLAGLGKPVILTGSQLPMGIIRTDGKENFITSIEIAAARHRDGSPLIQEVAVYFEYRLYRGNRTTKVSASHFNAFDSPNFPSLAEAGVDIRYNHEALLVPEQRATEFDLRVKQGVVLVKLYPGITATMLQHMLNTPIADVIVMETFGAGNAPSAPWFLHELERAVKDGKVIVNVTQCLRGQVDMSRYSTGIGMLMAGVCGGRDLTSEAAVTKAMVLLGRGLQGQDLHQMMATPLAGEMAAG